MKLVTLAIVVLTANLASAQLAFDSVVIEFTDIPVSGSQGYTDGYMPGSGSSSPIPKRLIRSGVTLRNPKVERFTDTVRLTTGAHVMYFKFDSNTNFASFIRYDYYSEAFKRQFHIKNVVLYNTPLGPSTHYSSDLDQHLVFFSESTESPATHGSKYFTHLSLDLPFSPSSTLTVHMFGSIPMEVHRDNDTESSSLLVYPNPADRFIRIHPADDQQYTIYDHLGRIILGGNLSSDEIDVSSLPSGLFYVKFSGGIRSFLIAR